jgi:hypothetical protein
MTPTPPASIRQAEPNSVALQTIAVTLFRDVATGRSDRATGGTHSQS